MNTHPALQRVDTVRSTVRNPHNVPTTLFANADVDIQGDGVEQLLGFLSLAGTLGDLYDWERAGRIAPFWGDTPGRFESVVVTPDFHRGGGIPVGVVAEAHGFVVPAAVGNDVCCFTGDTRIPLVDGRVLTFQELVDKYRDGDFFYVYSVTPEGRITAGKAGSPRKTRTVSSLVEVTLDNGSKVKCTPDHLWLLRDGTYREAKDLVPQDSLMPFYRFSDRGYTTVKHPADGTCERMYRVSFRECYGRDVTWPDVIHHDIFCQTSPNPSKSNDDPRFLAPMNEADHFRLHSEHTSDLHRAGKIGWRLVHKKYPEKMSRMSSLTMSRLNKDPSFQKRRNLRFELSKKKARAEGKFDANWSKVGVRGAPTLIRYNQSELGRAKSRLVGLANLGRRFPRYPCPLCGKEISNQGRHGHMATHNNHRVMGVKPLVETADVYCMTVEKYENFALEAGVFVHNCGMRLLTTDVTREELEPHLDALGHRLRAIFFQGQRDIPMSPRQREAVLKDGLWGLHETIADNGNTGLWRYYDPAQQGSDLLRTHFQGVLPAKDTFGFGDYIRASGNQDGRDPQIGSVGGGNHFVELQEVRGVLDGPTAHTWGLSRHHITIMAHSGSLGLGHMVGGHYVGKAHSLYPKGVPHPEHGFYVFPTGGPHAGLAKEYLDAMRNAANFAFANRLCLGLMVLRALGDVLGRPVGSRLVYDAPHNLIWEPTAAGDDRYRHRKGACPALGPSAPPFEFTGHPVIIPGSMGSPSYVLAGEGNESALCSACHGAGRGLTRGQAAHVPSGTYEREVAPLRVITAIDPDSPQVKGRQDILGRYRQRLLEEAPGAYKPITPVVGTVEEAGIARRVVELVPILTVKG